ALERIKADRNDAQARADFARTQADLGYAQLLESDPAIPAQRLNGIRVIRRSAQHLSGLIDGLLDISRMEAGRLEIHRDEVRLTEFLDQLVDMVRL
ncbi:hypothetical protein NYY70_20305, partial [Acinetobacter baumannii]|nr:hypothetical protein [Acinetobacter baumannii]